MLKTKRTKVCALILSLTLSLSIMSGCGKSSSSSGASTKDTLIVGVDADVKSLDPQATADMPSVNVYTEIYETLVYQDEEMKIKPGLAESWEKIDDLTYEFKLRKGVKFHNGEEMKASDVKFTFDRASKAPAIAHIVGEIDPSTIKVIDEYTIRLSTKHPFAALIASLCHSGASILSEKAVTDGGKEYINNPVGTGPYKFVSHKNGDSTTLVRFEDYYGDKPKIKNLVMRVIPEVTNRTIELETGGIDIAYAVGINDVKRIEGNKDLAIYKKVGLSTNYLGFNTVKKPFDNIKIRQAINYAIDVDTIIASVYEGIGIPAKGPLGPNVWASNKDVKSYGFDLKKAKELMKEAGMESGFKTTLWTNDTKERMDIAEIVQNELKEVNITVEIKVLEWGAYLDGLAKGEHDMFILGWNVTTADPDTGLFAVFNSANKGTGGNRAFYSNPKVDQLLAEGRKTFESEARMKIYYELQQIITDDAPWVFLNNTEYTIGANKSVKGLILHTAGSHKLFKTYFE